jgi:KDO2-lipid IV(A) lauroyltransferase
MTNFFSRILFYGLALPISYLPFRVLYAFSDFLYIISYHIIGYRKEVVRKNLKNSFPQLSEIEIISIEKKFYRHFTDFLVESAKSFTISEKDIKNRCSIVNPELPNSYFEQGRSVMILCGHYNNWEYYAAGLQQQMNHKTIAAFHPLKNKFFDRIIKKSRERFGMKMVSMREIPRFFASTSSEPTMAIMVNDQSPGDPKKAYWNTFLNQDTGWMRGTERLAAKYDQSVLFGCIRKVKRGFYEVTFYPITDEPNKVDEGFILDKHTEYLEMVISEHPEFWLWSHKRWKHKRPN